MLNTVSSSYLCTMPERINISFLKLVSNLRFVVIITPIFAIYYKTVTKQRHFLTKWRSPFYAFFSA